MKLTLFLDIDGVLNHNPQTPDCGNALRKFAGDNPNGFDLICPKCVERVNKLIGAAVAYAHYDEVEIVLSSTWRRYFDSIKVDDKLGRAGFDYHIDALTPINEKHRGQQIHDYMEDNPTDAFIVLDDDTYDMDLVKDNQIATDFKLGFDDTSLEKALKLIMEIRDR